ncbi:LysM peptidoglycan-binding domain-containing protein [Roseovarius sp. EL26]|uniref:LysM peptidoglycan-binding domain-containing protein n=1 Tax=Roseovarius sp. EL26 TaxID=2126672 RepID=UPI0013C4A826|nr:LysM peptidoglycan-binding domain-containing protein [Roseovarius sp. EL26]
MAQKSGFSGGMALGFVAAIAVCMAIFAAVSFFSPQDDAENELNSEQSAPTVEVDLTESELAESEKDLPLAPEISTFFLDPDGQGLLAGRAPAGWEVTVLLDGEPMATVQSGPSGEFAEFFELEASSSSRVLSLAMTSPETGETFQSRDEVIVTELADTEVTQRDEIGVNNKTVLLADETGVQVLQAPSVDAPEVMSNVALDSITYSDEGEVQLSGRALGEGFVRVYLDNAPVTLAPIEEGGNWQSELSEIDTGVYTLRVDELDTEGNVTSRVETPFKREDQDNIAEHSADGEKIKTITVQPGNTLWAISRAAYGDGYAYIRVFEANRDRIRNPDLIYPGQVFSVPE